MQKPTSRSLTRGNDYLIGSSVWSWLIYFSRFLTGKRFTCYFFLNNFTLLNLLQMMIKLNINEFYIITYNKYSPLRYNSFHFFIDLIKTWNNLSCKNSNIDLTLNEGREFNESYKRPVAINNIIYRIFKVLTIG